MGEIGWHGEYPLPVSGITRWLPRRHEIGRRDDAGALYVDGTEQFLGREEAGDYNGTGHGNVGPVTVAWLGDGAGGGPGGDDGQRPVFVLSAARSGSTLLRFILDSHPDLACPPETNVGQVCFGLARLWDLLEPSPESSKDGWRPEAVPAHLPRDAAAAIRTAVNEVYGRYLDRHGKSRWCDKSLDSALMADLLAHLYPGAQFVCLYRHCMDVVVSAIEASPWGLSGYGFDPYVTNTPGNMVLAAARCWQDQTRAIIEFQDKHPDRCHGVRYEDLVTRPEEIAADLFTFLDLVPVPGITQTCLRQEHDTRGPADHKIWFTSRISTASLGRGVRVPAQMLPPELLTKLNQTLDQLAYRQVDERWTTAPGPLDPRADAARDAAPGEPASAELDATAGEIARRLGSIPEEQVHEAARRWPDAAGRTLLIAVQSPDSTRPGRCWTVSCTGSVLAVRQGETGGDASVTCLASSATWQALLEGRANPAAELRAGRLRLGCTPAGPHAHKALNLSAEMHLIAHLLGLDGSSKSPGEPQEASVVLAVRREG